MSKKTKEVSISLYLEKIQEIKFSFNSEYDYSNLDEYKLKIGFENKLSVDTDENLLHIDMGIVYKDDENIDLMSSKVRLSFSIKDIMQHVIISEGEVQANSDLIGNLLSITIGTLRGLLYARTHGTPLENYPLPLIPASDIFPEKNK